MTFPVRLTAGEIDFLWGMVGIIDGDLATLKSTIKHVSQTCFAKTYDDASAALQVRLATHVDTHDDDPHAPWGNESIPLLYRAVTPGSTRARRVERAMILDKIVHDVMENGVVIVPDVVRLEQDRIDTYLPDNDRNYVRALGAAQRMFFENALSVADDERNMTRYNNALESMGAKYGFAPDLSPN